MKLYVGNFNYMTTVPELKKLFAEEGSVINVRIVHDQFTRQSKCFGFVNMINTKNGNKAIEALHGKNLKNHRLIVKKAKKI